MKRLHGKLTYNGVGAKQIKKGAVTPEKLNAAAKSGMTGPRGLEGPRGAEGLRGPEGPRGGQGERGEKGAQGDKGESGEKGEKGDRGTPATSLFAQIKEDGTINTGGATVTSMKFAKGLYLVNFGQDITRCVVVANQGGIPIFETPGGATSATNGYGARVDIVSPKAGAKYAPGFPADQTAAISTFLGAEPEDTTFYVAALC